jgi:hypothetical protein
MRVISFRVIVWFCFLFFSATGAPLSGMDDRETHGTVTNLFRRFSLGGERLNYFVTFGPAGLSSSLVWTGFALHG